MARALGITVRELEILRRLAGSQSQEEIARELTLSRHTIDTHVRKLYRKLKVHSRTMAVTTAIHRGLL